MPVPSADRDRLFLQFRTSLGAPLRQVEITDDMLCTLLDIAIQDYSQHVLNFLIEMQWFSLFGQSISKTDFAFAFSVRSQDYVSQYTYAYSKQVGLQTNGPWELKKDFVRIERGRQVYTIPAGREVNEVLWITPATTDQALLASYGGMGFGFGGLGAQVGAGFGAGGMGSSNMGYYITPAFDVLLTASDMNLKNRMIASELVYKITKGPNGTRLLHLLSTPGSNFNFGAAGGLGSAGLGGINLTGCQVWYHYYDTTPDNVNDCRAQNPDIILLPNDVPLGELDFSTFNDAAKATIRQLFIAEAKKALGRVRGKFGGVVGPPEAERTMDYDTLLTEGNDEKRIALEGLDALLLRLSTTSQLERAATEATALNTAIKYRPLGFWVH